MKPVPFKNLLAIASMTFFAMTSLAGQQATTTREGSAKKTQQLVDQNETIKKLNGLPPELKNLPVILDSKNLQIEKFKKIRIENLDLDKMYGPGSSGGGNLCAFNITTAAAFIAKNIDVIPFQNKQQRDNFLQKMASTIFMSGANLSVRGQSVDALNYPSYGVIVLNGHICDQLADESLTAYSTLLHEYLGVAGIDDRTYQISGTFAAKLKSSFPAESECRTDGCVMRKELRTDAAMKWLQENDDCTNAVSWMQSFRKISESRFEVICGDTSDQKVLILQSTEVPGSDGMEFKAKLLSEHWIERKSK